MSACCNSLYPTGLEWFDYDDIGKVLTCEVCGTSYEVEYDETFIEETGKEYQDFYLVELKK